jgi:hypothetical protein
MPGGGGGSQTASVQLPDYVDKLAQENVSDISRLANRPYQPYSQPRIAGMTPDQNASMQIIRNQTGSWQDPMRGATEAMTGAAGYQPGQVSMSQVGARDVGTQMMPMGDMAGYMNPYVDKALAPQLAEIDKFYGQQQSQLGAQNALSGAFGSDQDAVMRATLMGDQGRTRAGAVGQGYLNAFNSAAQNWQTDQSRALQAAGMNQGANLQASGMNQNAALQAGGMNQNAALQAGGMNQNAGLQANQQRMQAGQGLMNAGQMTQSLGQSDANALYNAGAAQQGMGQQSLDLQYGDFLNQQNYPIDMVNLRTAALSGNPYSVSQTVPQSSSKGSMMGGAGSLLSGGALAIAPYLNCWVAREVYGVTDSRWLMFREWMFGRAPQWLAKLYLRHGEAFARWLRDKPAMKAGLRLAMDAAI